MGGLTLTNINRLCKKDLTLFPPLKKQDIQEAIAISVSYIVQSAATQNTKKCPPAIARLRSYLHNPLMLKFLFNKQDTFYFLSLCSTSPQSTIQRWTGGLIIENIRKLWPNLQNIKVLVNGQYIRNLPHNIPTLLLNSKFPALFNMLNIFHLNIQAEIYIMINLGKSTAKY